MEFLIVTGVSGAGKTCVANALEDIGYFCMDNVPARLISEVAGFLKTDYEYEKVAVVTDIRAGLSCEEFSFAVNETEKLGITCKTMFVDCKNSIIFSRYKQSRRRHPLADNTFCDTMSAIALEKEKLKAVKEKCSFYLDTSELSYGLCKSRIAEMFSDNVFGVTDIHCVSFGFKHGIPEDADFVFDLRFLPNPFYVHELKELTGLEKAVSDYVMQFDSAKKYFEHIEKMLDFAIPECLKEGRSQLVIAFGCTGGHHRSVTFAQLLESSLKNKGYKVSVSHRDILK